MTTSLEYTCSHCGEIHTGLPAWHFDFPLQVLAIPEDERPTRVALSEDDCVIDGTQFFVKGLLEVPLRKVAQPFTWGVWLSISESDYDRFAEQFGDATRSAGDSFFGWLCNSVPGYPDTQLLKTYVHVREFPMRPWVELEPTPHPLAIDQRDGVTTERAIAIAEQLLHPPIE